MYIKPPRECFPIDEGWAPEGVAGREGWAPEEVAGRELLFVLCPATRMSISEKVFRRKFILQTHLALVKSNVVSKPLRMVGR